MHKPVADERSDHDWPALQLLGNVAVRLKAFQSLGEAENVWRKAQIDCACYGFQTFEWQSTYQETIGAVEGVEPKIIHIADAEEKTLMLLPLGICRRHGVSVLGFLGGHPTDYHAPLICPAFAASLDRAACERLVGSVLALLPRVDVIAFERMPSVIEDITNPFVQLVGTRRHRNAHAATLDGTFRDFKARRSSKFFRESERRKRRLNEVAPANFLVAKSAEEAAAILPELITQKRRQYRRTGVVDHFAKPHYLDFYSSLGQRHWRAGLIHTSALYAGEAMVAAHWGMLFRDRFYWILPSYEARKWSRYSAGRLLMQSVVEWCISRGIKTFDLTIGDDEYKLQWTDHVLPLHACYRGITARGRIYLWLSEFRDLVKQRAKRSQWLVQLVRKWRGLRNGAFDVSL